MIGYEVGLRNDRLALVRTRIDAGVGPGKIRIYGASRPATGVAITSQVLLVEGTFSDPCAPVPAAGELVFNAITYDNALADGVAVWARVTDSADVFVMDMDVGIVGSGKDVIVTSLLVTTGAPMGHVAAKIVGGNL